MAYQITPLPTPVPLSTDPANFDARADALIAALPEFVDDTNLVAGEINQTAQLIVGTWATDSSAITMVASGNVSFTIDQLNSKTFAIGMPVVMYKTTAPTTYRMSGNVTAFNSGTGDMTVNVTSNTGGTTSQTGWTIAASAPVIYPSPMGSYLAMNAFCGIF